MNTTNPSDDEWIKIKTSISTAYTYAFKPQSDSIEESCIKFGKMAEEEVSVSWFDKLFNGGIKSPNKSNNPLVILISGPAGSGKTTLALEICYRLSKGIKSPTKNPESLSGKKLKEIIKLYSAYISFESTSNQILDNSKYFWPQSEDYMFCYKKNPSINEIKPLVIWGKENIKLWSNAENLAFKAMADILPISGISRDNLTEYFSEKLNITFPFNETNEYILDLVVVDGIDAKSFNNSEAKNNIIQKFIDKFRKKAKILIISLDADSSANTSKLWEYSSDIVIKLDYSSVSDYLIRTIEVVKARYQSHVLGKHQIKIYSLNSYNLKESNNITQNKQSGSVDINKILRSHPYLNGEGGIYIYPSLHYFLSIYKRNSFINNIGEIQIQPEPINEIARIPSGRCTVFIGSRGSHKSHLAYMNILDKVIHNGYCGIIVSLRDDEEMTRQTLARIMEQEFPMKDCRGTEDYIKKIKSFELLNKLSILYYAPGYITPEEFFHRLFINIQLLRKYTENGTILLFNSIDQINARFPLCASQKIFIPGIIEVLSGEDITSIFIAVEDKDQPVDQYGLMPMADLILSFNRRRFSYSEYYNHLLEFYNKSKVTTNIVHSINDISPLRTDDIIPKSFRDEVVVKVVRFAGGNKSGSSGILELVNQYNIPDDNGKIIYKKNGLHFTPLSPKHGYGESIED